MREITPRAFQDAAPYPNEKFNMNWGRPVVIIEVPGTTPLGLSMHLHSRSVRNEDHKGFFDQVLTARGMDDTGAEPLIVQSADMVTCEVPVVDSGRISSQKLTGPAAHLYEQRARVFMDSFKDGETALIRHYSEYSPDPVLEKMQKSVEYAFFRRSRILFIERTVPLLGLIRHVAEQGGGAPFAITKEQAKWFSRCMMSYIAHKEYWKNNLPGKIAVASLDDILKGQTAVRWGDGVTAMVDVPSDRQCDDLLFNVSKEDISITNYREVESWFRPQRRFGLSQAVRRRGQTSG